MLFIDNAVSPSTSTISKFDFPRSGNYWNYLSFTLLVVRLFPWRLLLIELLFAPLNFVLARTSLIRLGSEKSLPLEQISPGRKQGSFCVSCLRRAGARWQDAYVTARYRQHGKSTAARGRPGDKRIIERPNRRGKSEFENARILSAPIFFPSFETTFSPFSHFPFFPEILGKFREKVCSSLIFV